ncbi:unnamed protein product [marine sediment metagenome]|uniref:Uncharacterized protein n=1 Tax=marine sediment metagenome TaxID=412755 RepID=X0ZND2_9ZZZZ
MTKRVIRISDITRMIQKKLEGMLYDVKENDVFYCVHVNFRHHELVFAFTLN